MKLLRKKFTRFGLLIGDLTVLSVSLYLALTIRYLALPGAERLAVHFEAFFWLFLIWVCVYFIAGLYDRQTLFFPKFLPQRVFRAQIANSVIGIAFFYAVPYFAITPKTNLFIFVAISFAFILLWRNLGSRLLTSWLTPSDQPRMVLVAGGGSAHQLADKLKASPHQGIRLTDQIDPDKHSAQALYQAVRRAVGTGSLFVVVDSNHPTVRAALPQLYGLLYEDVRLFAFDTIYEQIFERVPLSQIGHRWFVEQVNLSPHLAYDFFKRVMDTVVSAVLLLLSALFFPFIAFAIWWEDGTPIFYSHKRIGEGGKRITITKLRSMKTGDSEDITAVGWFLRRTRIDEFPQLWSVFVGDLSLIGPRPEMPKLVKQYQQEIDYYNARHLVKPGISGWAQLKHRDPPKYGKEVAKTKQKLSYDLYYVKHRSFMLDIEIALRTLQVIFSQSGR
jgi:lipopolysaccharide/colanic/teichoic acid biosynthesis glycosyltransferase